MLRGLFGRPGQFWQLWALMELRDSGNACTAGRALKMINRILRKNLIYHRVQIIYLLLRVAGPQILMTRRPVALNHLILIRFHQSDRTVLAGVVGGRADD